MTWLNPRNNHGTLGFPRGSPCQQPISTAAAEDALTKQYKVTRTTGGASRRVAT
jgi:hypothetical protein